MILSTNTKIQNILHMTDSNPFFKISKQFSVRVDNIWIRVSKNEKQIFGFPHHGSQPCVYVEEISMSRIHLGVSGFQKSSAPGSFCLSFRNDGISYNNSVHHFDQGDVYNNIELRKLISCVRDI
jgi:hypothetical protein